MTRKEGVEGSVLRHHRIFCMYSYGANLKCLQGHVLNASPSADGASLGISELFRRWGCSTNLKRSY